jgi:riboflavin biosynthesis pyrimidine reductase
MIEGGPTLNWHMLHDRLVDEIRLIHLPFIVGGSDTPSLVGGMHINYRRRDDPSQPEKILSVRQQPGLRI